MKKLLSLLLLTILLSISCKKEVLEVPSTYDSTNFNTNNAEAKTLLTRLNQLSAELKKGRSVGVLVTSNNLNSIFVSGSPSIEGISQTTLKPQFVGLFNYVQYACGNTYNPFTPNTTGGLYGASTKYILNPYGEESGEIADKALYGGAVFNYVSNNYLSGEVSLSDLDNALTLYGAHPDFSNSDKSVNHNNPDVWLAKYAARRDDNKGAGFYLKIKNGFLTAQAAIKGGSQFNDQKNEAITAIKENMEKAIAATIINYVYASKNSYSLTSPSTSDLASALHATGEAIGFTLGLKGISDKKITDAQLDVILSKLHYRPTSQRYVYDFIQQPISYVSDLQAALNELQSIYGFSSTEMEAFKFNQVNLREP